MIFVLAMLVAILLTVVGAWLLGRLAPNLSRNGHILLAALSFPMLSVIGFILMTLVTLLQDRGHQPGDPTGMVIFAMVFFLVYALIIGVMVGLPTAVLAVTQMRKGQPAAARH